MKVKFILRDSSLTSNISQQTYDMVHACWKNGEPFKFGNGRINGKDVLGIEVLGEDD